MFDALHDMGDPVGAIAHIRRTMKADGTLMLVEPAAGDTLEENLNPVGRVYYAGSTHICLPTSLNQEVALGARRTGRCQAHRRGRARRRLLPVPQGDGDAVQHDPGSAAVTRTADAGTSSGSSKTKREQQ